MKIVNDKSMRFPRGIIPYAIDSASYDQLIVSRLQAAMNEVEALSCLVFSQLRFKPIGAMNSSWLHFTNPTEERSCVHQPVMGDNGEIVIVIGFECMTSRNILHVLLHALGFNDEVTHPHRDQYIRIMWKNIQPGYRPLFHVKHQDAPHKLVEYDPMSVMHFHDRAFSINGGPTIMPKVPGLLIAPQDKLSQLDVMKLRLWYGHECNKRKVSALLDKCKAVIQNNQTMKFMFYDIFSYSYTDDSSSSSEDYGYLWDYSDFGDIVDYWDYSDGKTCDKTKPNYDNDCNTPTPCPKSSTTTLPTTFSTKPTQSSYESSSSDSIESSSSDSIESSSYDSYEDGAVEDNLTTTTLPTTLSTTLSTTLPTTLSTTLPTTSSTTLSTNTPQTSDELYSHDLNEVGGGGAGEDDFTSVSIDNR